jgi:MerR family transcriptional regulator, copper efflux regulator
MLIKELEKKTGLTRHTIRFYEKEGFLEKRSIHRGENNYRDYSEDAVAYLMMLKAGQAAGFTLAELKEVIQADEANELPLQKKVELIRQKMKEIERKKAELDQVRPSL